LRGPVPATGPGYTDYWADLAGRDAPDRGPPAGVLQRLLARDIRVVLAPWQFNTASGDTDLVYDDAAFTAADFADFWGKFAAVVNAATGDDRRVAFDLVNEPHTQAESGGRPGDVGIGLADWFACAQAAVDAIRAVGATNTVLVPGMDYAAAGSFTANGNSTAWLGLTDPRRDLAVTVHCYDGLGSSSPTVLRDACSALVAWARTHAVKVHVGEIALDAGDNGRPVHRGTLATAREQWADWDSFCAENEDVLVGWNWWANSAAGWWDQGDSSDGSHWGLTLDDGATQTVYMDLIEATL
jgi:Cellulase (glycosyl hydrolase family 5)